MKSKSEEKRDCVTEKNNGSEPVCVFWQLSGSGADLEKVEGTW